MFVSRAELARNVIRTIEAHGVTVAPTSRLGQMRRATVNPDGTPRRVPPDAVDFQVALEANRDLQLLDFVLRHIGGDVAPPDFRLRLRRLIKDAALPQDQPADSRGRDEQFELYLAAVCAKAGLKPTFAEPDVVCDLDGDRYAVAAKRLKSLDSLKDRLKGGMRQVAGTGLPGCVVADVSVALNPENWRVPPVVDDRQFSRVAEHAMRAFVDDHFRRFVDWRAGTTVQGVVLVDDHVRQDPRHGWGLETLTFYVDLVPHHAGRRRQFARFAERYRRGLATPAFSAGDL